ATTPAQLQAEWCSPTNHDPPCSPQRTPERPAPFAQAIPAPPSASPQSLPHSSPILQINLAPNSGPAGIKPSPFLPIPFPLRFADPPISLGFREVDPPHVAPPPRSASQNLHVPFDPPALGPLGLRQLHRGHPVKPITPNLDDFLLAAPVRIVPAHLDL